MSVLREKYKTVWYGVIFLLNIVAANPLIAQIKDDHSADWMRRMKFGIMVHYLAPLQNGTAPHNMGKVTSWDSCVNDFNVNLFAKQLHRAGAGYVIFTLYQGSRFICTPNGQYEKVSGYARGEATAHRDLVMDLSNALQKYKIRLFLYVTGDGTFRDDQSNKAFKSPMLQYQQNGNKFTATDVWVNNWAAVLREWSMRYGKKIAGWWVDGSYQTHGYNDALLYKFYDALKSGNPNSIISFNNAVHPAVTDYAAWDNYTAGEMNDFKDVPPAGGRIKGKQWHILSFLGTDWQSPAVRFTTSYLTDYINKVNALGGVVTINTAVYRSGSIAPLQLAFLKQVNRMVRPR